MKLKYRITLMILVSLTLTGCGQKTEEQNLTVKYFNSDPTNVNANRKVEGILNEAVVEMSGTGAYKVVLKNGGEGSNDIQKAMNEAFIKKGDSDVIIVTDLPLKNIIDKKMALNLKESIDNYDEVYECAKNEYALGIGQTRWLYYVKKNLGVQRLNEEGWRKIIEEKDKGKFILREIGDLSPIIDENIKYGDLFKGNIGSEDLYNGINAFAKNINNRIMSPKLATFEERSKFYCQLDRVRDWNNKCVTNSIDELSTYPTPCFDFFNEDELIKQKNTISDQYELVFSEKSDTIYALIPKNSKNKKQAIEFVNKLVSKEYQNKSYNKLWSEYVVHETNRKVTEERIFESNIGKQVQAGFMNVSSQPSKLGELSLTTFQYYNMFSLNVAVLSIALDPLEMDQSKDEILPELNKFVSDIKTSNGE